MGSKQQKSFKNRGVCSDYLVEKNGVIQNERITPFYST